MTSNNSLSTDDRLTLIYKEMIGLSNIDNTSGNTIFQQNINFLGPAYIYKSLNLSKDTTAISNIYISSNYNCYSDSTFLSNLYISNNANINRLFTQNITINNILTGFSNMGINGQYNIINDATVVSNLYVSDKACFNNPIILNKDLINSGTINIYGTNIIFGSINSQIQIYGTNVSLIANNMNISDRLISLNINPTTQSAFDSGFLSGIEIYSSSGLGYIKTSNDAMKFLIKAPTNSNINYIGVTEGTDNSFNISGNVNLYQNATICSSIFVNNNTIMDGSTTFLSALNISGNSVLQGNTTIKSTLTISGQTNLLGDSSIKSDLCVLGPTSIGGSVDVNGSMMVSGLTSVNGALTIMSLLYTSNPVIVEGSITINSLLNIANKSILNGSTTIASSVNLAGVFNCQSDMNVYGLLNVNGNAIINKSITIDSSLNVVQNTNFNNTITLQSNLSIYGNLINQLPEYSTNRLASKNIPEWEWYRTGGIVKIRLEEILPPEPQFIAFLLDYNIVTSFTAMNPSKPVQFNSVTRLWNWNPIYWQPYTITSITPNITISGYNNSTVYFPYGGNATLASPNTNLPIVFLPGVSLAGLPPLYITPSYKTLQDIKFSYTKSWTFVTKIIHRNGDLWAENLDIMFDSIASGNPPTGNSWTTRYRIRLLYGSIQLIQYSMAGISFSYSISGIFGTFSGSGIGRNEYWNFKTTNQIGDIGWVATGFFVVISYDRSTFTTSVIIINKDGTTLATINISTPNTNYYASTIANGIPFAIQVTQHPMQFYEGFVYFAAPTITYSTLVSLFPTGTTFTVNV